jgi:SAM-dependent methyltransferase
MTSSPASHSEILMIRGIRRRIDSWDADFKNRESHASSSREPYFQLCENYLPSHAEAIVLDIGAGNGAFVDQLSLDARFRNVWLLDGNPETVATLEKSFHHACHYVVPGRLPFDDLSVSFVHSSHLIEHLSTVELYEFLKEVDRVLEPSGVLVISAPLLWNEFYDDLSHVKPYPPAVFINYLCRSTVNRTRAVVSTRYRKELLQYRYTKEPATFLGSSNPLVDFVIQVGYKITRFLGVARYSQNGFTLVLRKSERTESAAKLGN